MQTHLWSWLRWLKGAGRAESTISAYATDVWEFLIWWGAQAPCEPAVGNLRPRLLQEYQAHLGSRGLARSTICRKLDALSGFFGYLVRAELIDRNPLESVPRSRPKSGRLVWMPEEEARRVLEVVSDPTERAVFMTLYRAGLRKGELMALRLGDVDLEGRTLTVEARKTRTVRHVPISAELDGFLRAYLTQRPECASDCLFVTASHHVGLYSTLLQRWFRRWMHDADLSDRGYCIHTLRHSAATNWLDRGLNVVEVQHLLGHTSLATTSRYLHYSTGEMRAKMDRISLEPVALDHREEAGGATPSVGDNPIDRLAAQMAEAAERGDMPMVTALTRRHPGPAVSCGVATARV